MTCGIYKLKFKGTDKVYIGQSLTIENRYKRHIYLLSKKASAKRLQEAYEVYGSPELDILVECEQVELNELESLAIELYNSFNQGLNSRKDPGISGSTSSSDHYNCKYTKDQIIQVFKLLLSDSMYLLEDIEKISGVSRSVINHILNMESHFWLAEEFPEEYDILYYRKINKISRNSAKSRGILYPIIYSPIGEAYQIENMCQFAKEHGLQQANLCNVLHGKNKTIKGWHL